MHTVTRSLILPYEAVDMYSLVDQIDQYQEFLPWCKDSVVLERTDKEVVARIEVYFKGLHTAFTTRNCLFSEREIKIELVDGPFDQLEGRWEFASLDKRASRVTLQVNFSLASRLANQTITPVFKRICGTLVESFAERAKQIYGEQQFV